MDAVARWFWLKHQRILRAHGLSFSDVRQQAWVEYLTMQEKSQPVSLNFLQSRLLDWMRHVTHWNHGRNVRRDALVLMKTPPELSVELRPEQEELRRIMHEEAAKLGGKTSFILTKYLEGYSMKSIGAMCKRTEGRISQQIKSFVVHMRAVVALLVALLVAPLFVSAQLWAQTPPVTIGGCGTLSWKASTETDLDGYHAYISKDGVTQPRVKIGKQQTSIACSALGIVEGSEYVVGLTAYDTSSNESAIATPPTLAWPDKTPPATVTSVCWDVLEIVVDANTGKVISSTPAQRCE